MLSHPDADRLHQLAPDCRRCPRLVESRERIAWGNGSCDATLVVVGEAPGRGDPDADVWKGGNWTGMAYTSRHSGRRIRSLLVAVGYGQDDCYFTNAVKCFPAAEDGANRPPTANERANCRPYLRREVDRVEPAVVLATGKHATQTLLAIDGASLDGFLEHVLTVIDCPTIGVPVVPLLHPSYQEVWLPQIDHTRESYRRALGQLLSDLGA